MRKYSCLRREHQNYSYVSRLCTGFGQVDSGHLNQCCCGWPQHLRLGWRSSWSTSWSRRYRLGPVSCSCRMAAWWKDPSQQSYHREHLGLGPIQALGKRTHTAASRALRVLSWVIPWLKSNCQWFPRCLLRILPGNTNSKRHRPQEFQDSKIAQRQIDFHQDFGFDCQGIQKLSNLQDRQITTS